MTWRRRQTAPAPRKHMIKSERDPEGMPDQSVASLSGTVGPFVLPISLGRRVELSSSPFTQKETKAH